MEVELPWMLYWVIGLGSLGSLMSGAIRIYNSRSTRELRYAQAAEAWSMADRHHSKASGAAREFGGSASGALPSTIGTPVSFDQDGKIVLGGC